MQRRQRPERPKLVLNFVIDTDGRNILRSAMHNAVADAGELRRLMAVIGEPFDGEELRIGERSGIGNGAGPVTANLESRRGSNPRHLAPTAWAHALPSSAPRSSRRSVSVEAVSSSSSMTSDSMPSPRYRRTPGSNTPTDSAASMRGPRRRAACAKSPTDTAMNPRTESSRILAGSAPAWRASASPSSAAALARSTSPRCASTTASA